jgi:hypothetical protein
MSKKDAQKKALQIAVQALEGVDFTSRADLLKLPFEVTDKGFRIRMFGKNVIISDNYSMIYEKDMSEIKVDEALLLLHFLQTENPVAKKDELISFRQLPGGMFYWEPFLSRTVRPMLKCLNGNIEKIKSNINRFDWVQKDFGDFSAEINAFANLNVTLILYFEDDEFPPSADVLFDASVKQLLPTEDVAVLAGKICFGLL